MKKKQCIVWSPPVSSFQPPENIISTSFVFVDGLCDNYEDDGVVVDGGVEEEDETKGDEDDFENQPYFSQTIL